MCANKISAKNKLHPVLCPYVRRGTYLLPIHKYETLLKIIPPLLDILERNLDVSSIQRNGG